MLPAAAASTALGSGVAVGAFGAGIGSAALGTGLAAGASLAGGGGLAGLFGLGGGAVAPGAFGALAPAVATKLAPAAAAQVAGTIGTAAGSVAPGAFGANLAGAAAPGLTGSAAQTMGLNALKSQAIGTGVQNAAAQQATNLAFQKAAAQNMAGGLANPMAQMAGYNPAMAQNLAPQFLANSPPIANANNPLLRSSVANYDKPYLAQNSVITDAPSMTSSELLNTATRSPYDLSTGLRTGVDPRFAGQQGIQTATGPTVDPTSIVGRSIRPDQNFMQNLGNIGSFQDVKDYAEQHPYATSAMAGLGAMGISKLMEPKKVPKPEDNAMIRPYEFERTQRPEAYAVSPTMDSSERNYFNDQFIAGDPYKASEKAEGGIASAYAMGGPVEQMAAMNAIGANTGYPQAGLQTPMYTNPMMQRPQSTNVIAPSADAGVNTYTGEARFARGGEANLGDYSDGGRLLKGPGDGVSDSIPASIGGRQPARLADGEFVIPARIVSELGNGSTEAGARKLYAMMERVQNTRRKSIGKKKVAVNSKADKHLPA
jgi:hypothetical protein